MIYPVIHLNGTHGPTLLEEYAAAAHAVENALDTLRKVTCHGRDYYVIKHCSQGDPSSVAFAEHCARLDKLADVANELNSIHRNIEQQLASRSKP